MKQWSWNRCLMDENCRKYTQKIRSRLKCEIYKKSYGLQIICCPYNLMIMTKKDNSNKGSNCSITLKQLILLYKRFLKDYPELKFSQKEDIEFIKCFEKKIKNTKKQQKTNDKKKYQK